MAEISTAEPDKSFVEVLGRRMAYVEQGEGDPIVLLHGNPTSSYLWRNIIPHLSGLGRCIAPDLIGMGDSDPLPGRAADANGFRYSFAEHSRHLDALLDALEIKDRVTLVIHDWGSALGFDWARRHPDAVRGIAYMEAIVRPMTWDKFSQEARPVFEGFRSPAGEKMILEKNTFVERVLPGSVMRGLSEAEMAVHRRPYIEPGQSRQPTLDWPRQIPLDGEPAEVVALVQAYADWMANNELPKLFVNAEPGAILIGAQREFCRGWPNQSEITVKGSHFIQEDSPDEIGRGVAAWLKGI